ncbi:MAG: DUF2950 family protein [Planctomycetes bacterium]|nr:DUF2950 family protein [Planctomycetota bacterium]
MLRKEGFTLIELMIVVAIIAIIAAISIPNLLASRKGTNEVAAIGSLKAIFAGEATWRQTGMSGTGRQDFWTYDVSGLYRMLKEGQPAAYISLDVAKADFSWHADDSITASITQDWNSISTTLGAKAGYYLQTMIDHDAAVVYNENCYAGTGVAIANNYVFGFMAAPAQYGSSGDRVFIINEKGVVYGADPMLDANKWYTTGTTERRWNSPDPTNTTTWPPISGGKPWSQPSN